MNILINLSEMKFQNIKEYLRFFLCCICKALEQCCRDIWH